MFSLVLQHLFKKTAAGPRSYSHLVRNSHYIPTYLHSVTCIATHTKAPSPSLHPPLRPHYTLSNTLITPFFTPSLHPLYTLTTPSFTPQQTCPQCLVLIVTPQDEVAALGHQLNKLVQRKPKGIPSVCVCVCVCAPTTLQDE